MKEVHQFWMVWSPQGHAPVCRHGSFELATTEARRLAMKCQGQEFYVLHSVRGFFMPQPGPQEIVIDDGIPF